MIRCDACDAPTANLENDYGEYICTSCAENRNEAAAERQAEDFHDGGSLQIKVAA